MNKESYLFITPLIAFVLAFVFIPVLGTFIGSLFLDVSYLEKKFIFFSNYVSLLFDPRFLQSLSFTVLFTLVSVPIELVLGLAFALALNARLSRLAIAIVLIPWAIPSAISGRIWELIYNYNWGVANMILAKVGLQPINWLGSDVGAFTAIILADVWKTTPFATIILLAGLQAIPEEIHLQAKVDGAGLVQNFFRVILPILKPIIVVVLLFRTIDALRIFDLVYVLTHGGPGGFTTSLSLYAYKYFIAGDFGYGSAVSVILFLVAFALALLYIKVGRVKAEIER